MHGTAVSAPPGCQAVTPPGVIAIVTLCHDGDYEISPPTPGVPDAAQLTAVGLSGDNSIQLSSKTHV